MTIRLSRDLNLDKHMIAHLKRNAMCRTHDRHHVQLDLFVAYNGCLFVSDGFQTVEFFQRIGTIVTTEKWFGNRDVLFRRVDVRVIHTNVSSKAWAL